MAENNAQDTQPGANADDGKPAGDRQTDDRKFEPPNDGSWIPKARFDEAVGGLKDQVRELSQKLEEVSKKPVDQPKHYTRTELNAMVESRQITQEQADTVMENQLRQEVLAESRQVAAETVIGQTRKERVASELARYKQLAPEILQESSDTRARVVEEYNYFVSLGDGRTLETELKAIRSVLGPVDRLAQARSGKPSGESHRETGGAGGDRGGKKPDSLKDGLSQRERDYYDKMIRGGQYKDWKEVETLVSSRKRATA